MESIMNVNKALWTHEDFSMMTWHDCLLYGIRFEDEVIFDLDYILKWVLDDAKKTYSYWVAPATLAFHKVNNLKIKIDIDYINGIEIESIKKEKINESETTWQINAQQGQISFVGSGYTQFIRKEPMLTKNQYLTSEQRCGYCFDQVAFKND